MDVYDVDRNLLDDSYDFMGRCLINIEDSAYIEIGEDGKGDNGKPPEPKWHEVFFKQGAPSAGKILCSFVITAEFDYEFKNKIPPTPSEEEKGWSDKQKELYN